MDANSNKNGSQAFHFIGTAHFHGTAGELHYATSGHQTIVSGDINGDGKADFELVLVGHIHLTAGDFQL